MLWRGKGDGGGARGLFLHRPARKEEREERGRRPGGARPPGLGPVLPPRRPLGSAGGAGRQLLRPPAAQDTANARLFADRGSMMR